MGVEKKKRRSDRHQVNPRVQDRAARARDRPRQKQVTRRSIRDDHLQYQSLQGKDDDIELDIDDVVKMEHVGDDKVAQRYQDQRSVMGFAAEAFLQAAAVKAGDSVEHLQPLSSTAPQPLSPSASQQPLPPFSSFSEPNATVEGNVSSTSYDPLARFDPREHLRGRTAPFIDGPGPFYASDIRLSPPPLVGRSHSDIIPITSEPKPKINGVAEMAFSRNRISSPKMFGSDLEQPWSSYARSSIVDQRIAAEPEHISSPMVVDSIPAKKVGAVVKPVPAPKLPAQSTPQPGQKITFPCPEKNCPRHLHGLASKDKLKQHYNSFHSTHRAVFVCGIDGCEKQFSREDDLRKHQKSSLKHSKVKPHVCAECGTSFTRKDSLTTHRMNMHPHLSAVQPPSEQSSLGLEQYVGAVDGQIAAMRLSVGGPDAAGAAAAAQMQDAPTLWLDKVKEGWVAAPHAPDIVGKAQIKNDSFAILSMKRAAQKVLNRDYVQQNQTDSNVGPSAEESMSLALPRHQQELEVHRQASLSTMTWLDKVEAGYVAAPGASHNVIGDCEGRNHSTEDCDRLLECQRFFNRKYILQVRDERVDPVIHARHHFAANDSARLPHGDLVATMPSEYDAPSQAFDEIAEKWLEEVKAGNIAAPGVENIVGDPYASSSAELELRRTVQSQRNFKYVHNASIGRVDFMSHAREYYQSKR